MNQKERLTAILDLLEQKNSLSQSELVNHFKISKDTARRDILKLVDMKLVDRYPGGISQPILQNKIEQYAQRLIDFPVEKSDIAQVANQLITDNQLLFMDVSTTVNFLTKELSSHNLSVVTNSIDNAFSIPQDVLKDPAILLGGYFNPSSRTVTGEAVIQQLQAFQFDLAFIGCSGLSKDGIFYDELSDIYLKETIIKQSKKVCLLLTDHKLKQTSSYQLPLTGIDVIITNKHLPEALLAATRKHQIKIITTKENL